MIKKLARIAVVTTMIPAAVVSVASPAKAWSYCNPQENSFVLYLYDNQGYCGAQHAGSPISVLQCHLTYGYQNWAAAAANRSSIYKVTLFNGDRCDGENFTLAPRTSHPNLYSSAVGINGMGNEVESFMYSYP